MLCAELCSSAWRWFPGVKKFVFVYLDINRIYLCCTVSNASADANGSLGFGQS